jgi:hypothetical protein
MTKNKKNYSKTFCFFDQKLQATVNVQATEEAFSSQKRKSSSSKHAIS